MSGEVKTWNVNATVVGGKHVGKIECRKSELASRVWSMGGTHIGLCHQCSDQCEGAELLDITAESADGDKWADGAPLDAGSALRATLRDVRELLTGGASVDSAVMLIDERHPELRDES